MNVNSVSNFKMMSFGSEKPEEQVQVKANTEAVLTKALEEDKFEKKVSTETAQPAEQVNEQENEQAKEPAKEQVKEQVNGQNGQGLFRIPTAAEIGKMQTTQKIMGGALAAVGLLGMASAFSPKKWVRCLFAIPVGGIISYAGIKMFSMASALDKLKDVVNSQGGQQ